MKMGLRTLLVIMVAGIAVQHKRKHVLGGAPAAQAPATNIRGTITGFDGHALAEIKTREGNAISVAVPDNANVAVAKAFTLADIKPGMVLAVVTVGQPDGAVVALNIRPLPPQVPTKLEPL